MTRWRCDDDDDDGDGGDGNGVDDVSVVTLLSSIASFSISSSAPTHSWRSAVGVGEDDVVLLSVVAGLLSVGDLSVVVGLFRCR